jgi:hypothetical protein
MAQTPTSPPPNVDATAAAAVAANVSAIPLSSGGMPVADIAAATTSAATNISAITTSTGGTPVAVIGLSIGGTNPNIKFASLGAGGKQQNSGNSAGFQPTTQLNSGFSAGLVGRFGATHSGSTSTTTDTSGSNYVPRSR